MSPTVNRKSMSKIWVPLVFCLFVIFCPRVASAINPARCEVSPRFGARETEILRTACARAVRRLQSKEVRQQVYQRAKYSLVSGPIMRLSNATDTTRGRWFLLQRQLATLALPNGSNDTEPAFPDIYIRYASEAPSGRGRGWVGKAPLNRVTVYWDSQLKEWRQRGSFDITINDYFVARGSRYSDPDKWVGTIAHELLHNLGHSHPSPSDPDYHLYQINVLDEIVENFGYGYKGTPESFNSLHDCEVGPER